MDLAGVRPAEETDLDAVIKLRDSLAHWQQSEGIEQWEPGEIDVGRLRRQMLDGELFVAGTGNQVIASVRICWSDPIVWGEQDRESAGYIHGLMVKQRGSGLGSSLLEWAERRISATGRTYARLDCVSGNERLRQYYRIRGYQEVGQREFPDHGWRPLVLLQKPLIAGDEPVGMA